MFHILSFIFIFSIWLGYFIDSAATLYFPVGVAMQESSSAFGNRRSAASKINPTEGKSAIKQQAPSQGENN